MRITDAQVHLWERVSIPEAAHRNATLRHEDLTLEMQQAGVHRAVLVPPLWAGDDNEVALAAARAAPERFAVMGKLDIDQREKSSEELRTWSAQPGMLGVRLALFSRKQQRAVSEGHLDWIWREAEAADIPVMIYPPYLLAELGRIAGNHPGLRLIVDHCGAPIKRGLQYLTDAVESLMKLSRHARIGVKISNLQAYSDVEYPFADVQEVILRVVDAFGPDRVFWGSDLTRLTCTYRQAVTMMTEDFPGLETEVLESVMGRSLSNWLGWPDPQ